MARIQYFLRVGIVPLFLTWRIFDFVIANLATFTIPYLGHFSHPTTLTQYLLPHWIKGFAQFDGIFYLRIAQNGYSQFEHAFFPLYPILIKTISPILGNNLLITSLLLANFSFLIGLVVFRKYLLNVLPENQKKNIIFVIAFLLLFPTSFFFGSSYTESLFFLMVISTFYFLHKRNYWLVALFSFLASLTRFVGLFLFIPITISVFQSTKPNVAGYKKLLVVLSPVLGLLTYIYYLWSTTGNPFAFFTSQTAFGAGRSTQLILLPQVLYRYIKILATAQINLGYFVALMELSIFLLLLFALLSQIKDLIRSKNNDLLGLNLFSLANIIVPTMTGTLLSIPRFSLLSLSFFLYMGLLKNLKMKLFILSIYLLLHMALLALFIQGYFVS